jgi:membrane-associated phospholipid phosphatase
MVASPRPVILTEQPVGAVRKPRPWLRWVAPAIYLVAVSVEVAVDGVPISRDLLLLWIAGGLLAFSLSDLRRFARGLLVEWLPFASVLFLYDLLRGYSDGLVTGARTLPQLRADEWLFGGTAPTVWLQEHLWHGAADLRWYDYATWGVYVTHFLATPLLAAVLWIAASPRFGRFIATVVVLALAGLTTYTLFPAVPPWLASVHGVLAPTERIVPEVWASVHWANLDAVFQTGSQYANDVAAMPSLHAAYSLLIALFLWDLVPTRYRWLRVPVALYPVAMALALVYGAEHYVVDILVGWIYAVAAYWLVTTFARRRAARRAGARQLAAGGLSA